MLRTSSLALVYLTAEYCYPAWSRSRNMKEVDVAINSALRTITGCLKPTPTQYSPILPDIDPASVWRNAATLWRALKYTLTEHFNNNLVHLKTRPRLSREAICTIGDWTDGVFCGTWVYRTVDSTPVAQGVEEVRGPTSFPSTTQSGKPWPWLSHSAWCKLNHLRMQVRHFSESLHRWRLAQDPWCPCGSGEAQTVEHIISGRCDSFQMPRVNADLASPLPALCTWLEENDLAV